MSHPACGLLPSVACSPVAPRCTFSELFAPEVRDWPGVPRYAHLLIDQTQVAPDELRGGLRGRAAQLALMVPHREGWPVMERLVPLLAELVQVWGLDEVEQIIVYVGATTRTMSSGTDFPTRYGERYREVGN